MRGSKAYRVILLITITFAAPALSMRVASSSSQNFSGEVWAWGENFDGQLGDGSNEDSLLPVAAKGLAGVIAVATGYDGHSLALKSDGTVWSWGSNACGQLGDGTNNNSNSPVKVVGLSDVIAIDTGGSDSGGCSLALKKDGTVWGWGENRDGQLGNDTRQDSNVPIRVGELNSIVAIAAGDDYCMALKDDGTVWGWGENHTHGKLGNGTNKDPPRGTFNQVVDMTTAVDIDASIEHSLALTSEGRVWAWGGNFVGQLGTTDQEFMDDKYAPVTIIGLTDVAAIAAGDLHNLALKKDGTVYAWGSNWKGQLGNGTFSSFYSFVRPVPGITGVTAIAAGGAHSLALKDDGTVWAWGSNSSGQVGDGTTEDRNAPVRVVDIEGATAIAAGGQQSLAVVRKTVNPGPAPVTPAVTDNDEPAASATAPPTISEAPAPSTTLSPPASVPQSTYAKPFPSAGRSWTWLGAAGLVLAVVAVLYLMRRQRR
jgi:alpha-tubulin suppressor-like RCC1 family protein